MSFFDKNTSQRFYSLLAMITLIGFLLRLHGLWSESITADEADTLFRIHSSHSVHELIDVWVKHDGHPPFIHLLEYFWTKIFGIAEGAVRFPFALLGTGAIWFAGRTARLWFGTGTGIAVAAGVAFLQFPLMYSQLARPYAPGLFFTMMLIWFMSKWFFSGENKKSDLVWFVVAAVGAVYSHYFSLLMAGLIGITGLFFLKRETWKPYLIACGIILLLFLPYINVFLYQLGVGGVGGTGGWLGKPTPTFFGNHIWFIFDESRLILIAAFAIALISIFITRSRPTKFHLMAFLLWVAPLLIGYLYSQKSPVLQNSTLLFSFPFLLMLIFAWIPPLEKSKSAMLIPSTLAALQLFYVTLYKPFHLTDHFGRLKELVSSTIEWQNKFNAPNVDVVYNVDIPYFIEYNYEMLQEQPKNVLASVNNGGKDLLEFKSMVQNSNADFFAYGWSTKFSSLEILPIIREKFPYLIEKRLWFNSGIYLFSKLNGLSKVDEKNEVLFESDLGFSRETTIKEAINKGDKRASWSSPFKLDSELVSMGYSVQIGTEHVPVYYSVFHGKIDSTCVYSPLLKMKVGDILQNPDNEILFTAKAQLLDSAADLIMVIQFEREGRAPLWNGRESTTQIDPADWKGWHSIYFGLQLPNDLKASDTVSVYCYTKDGKPIWLDDLELKTLKGHMNLYGPRANIK